MFTKYVGLSFCKSSWVQIKCCLRLQVVNFIFCCMSFVTQNYTGLHKKFTITDCKIQMKFVSIISYTVLYIISLIVLRSIIHVYLCRQYVKLHSHFLIIFAIIFSIFTIYCLPSLSMCVVFGTTLSCHCQDVVAHFR